MMRRPRSIFRARRLGRDGLLISPEVVGPESHYVKVMEQQARQLAGRLQPGKLYHNMIYHDEDCAIFGGGVCGCNPEAVVIDPDTLQPVPFSQARHADH